MEFGEASLRCACANPTLKLEGKHKREKLGCAQIARAAQHYDTSEEAAALNAKAAEHLFKLGGLMSHW